MPAVWPWTGVRERRAEAAMTSGTGQRPCRRSPPPDRRVTSSRVAAPSACCDTSPDHRRCAPPGYGKPRLQRIYVPAGTGTERWGGRRMFNPNSAQIARIQLLDCARPPAPTRRLCPGRRGDARRRRSPALAVRLSATESVAAEPGRSGRSACADYATTHAFACRQRQRA